MTPYRRNIVVGVTMVGALVILGWMIIQFSEVPAGWMRVLTNDFLGWFPERVINLHPARPGELPGTNAIERAWHQAMAGERSVTGVMVHLVPDEGVDDGPVLATEDVPIRPDDTLDSLEARIHAVEHRLLVGTIRTLCTSTISS